MTVGELIEKLKTLPQDRIVILQKDPEGNGHHAARGADDGLFWIAKSRDVVEAEYEGGEPCVVIWP